MGRQAGFRGVEHRLRQLSARGDPLEKSAATVDLEIIRAEFVAAQGPWDRSKRGRPPFDPVLKSRMLVLQGMHGLSRATVTVTRANMARNMKRWRWLDREGLPA